MENNPTTTPEDIAILTNVLLFCASKILTHLAMGRPNIEDDQNGEAETKVDMDVDVH